MGKRSNGSAQNAGWREYAAAILLTLGFFSIFYPEFTLAGDTYSRVEQTEGEEQICADYRRILNAQEGEVEIRLSFLERAAESFHGESFPEEKVRSAKKE